MNHLIPREQGDVTPVAKPTPARRRTSVEKAFPMNPRGQYVVNGRYVQRQPEVVYVEKKVLDSELKHVLMIFGPVIALAFLLGLLLWIML